MKTEKEFREVVKELRALGGFNSSNQTCFESFGEFIKDQAMSFCGGMFGVDREKSELYCVDMKTFEIEEINEYIDLTPLNEYEPGKNCWMTLDDFFVYYGETIKKSFGDDVWVRSLASWTRNKMEDHLDDTSTMIFHDVKTDDESAYILSNNGWIFEIECESRVKEGSYSKITKRDGFIKVTLDKYFETCWPQFKAALTLIRG